MSDLSVFIPYELKDVLVPKYKLKWNAVLGLWQCGNERVFNLSGMRPYHIHYLDVHFVNKEAAKKLGCKWAPISKKWCISVGLYNTLKADYDALAKKTKTMEVEVNYDDVVEDEQVA